MARVTDKRWKGHVIDWLEIADMDAVDYELKPLNQQQVAVLLMLLEYQKWETRWVNLGLSSGELQSFIGDIEYRLMQNQGAFLMTPEEYYDANKRSIYDAWNDIAKQVVSGRTTNIVVDADGGVSDPVTSDPVTLPEDDPLTPIDETESSRFGAVSEIAAKLEAFLDMVDASYGATNGAPVDFLATCQEKIAAYWPVDRVAMDTAISDYYAYRASQPRIIFDRGTAFPLYLYCNGYNDNVLGRWLIDVSTYAFPKQVVVLNLWKALADTFFSEFYAIGAVKPSSQYLDAACVPIAYQEFTNMVFAVARTTTPFKASHRMKFRVSGYALDVDGDIQDGMWYRTAAGVLTRSNWNFVHSAGSNLPSDNQVVYNSAHVYEYTIDLGALNQVMVVTPNKNAGMSAVGLTYPTPFKVEITDLGLAVS